MVTKEILTKNIRDYNRSETFADVTLTGCKHGCKLVHFPNRIVVIAKTRKGMNQYMSYLNEKYITKGNQNETNEQ